MKYDYPYSTNIVKYLSLLSNGDKDIYKVIEQNLKKKLEDSNCSIHKYKRYKTDRNNKVELKHIEAEVIFKFFKKEFDFQINSQPNYKRLQELQIWQPVELIDIYHKKPSTLAAA